jgi:spermidine synthase
MAAARRLRPNGLFAQWVQAYEVDDSTIQTAYATFHSVFPSVETWQVGNGDLLLVGSMTPRSYDADALRQRISQEPFRKALLETWRATNLEEVLAHFIANTAVADNMQRLRKADLNTDDRTVLEFAFARNVSLQNGFRVSSFRLLANLMREDRPSISTGTVDWPAVNQDRISMLLGLSEVPNAEEYGSETLQIRVAAYAAYLRGDLKNALVLWKKLGREPDGLGELLMVAECTADAGMPEAQKYIDQVRLVLPMEADAFTASFLWHSGHPQEATKLVERLLRELRTDPWLNLPMTDRLLHLAEEIARSSSDNETLRAIYQGLSKPFSARNGDATRLGVLLHVGMKLDNNKPGDYTLGAIKPVEPNVPWQEHFLKLRADCYRTHHDARLAKAERDLAQYESEQPSQIRVTVRVGQPPVISLRESASR